MWHRITLCFSVQLTRESSQMVYFVAPLLKQKTTRNQTVFLIQKSSSACHLDNTRDKSKSDLLNVALIISILQEMMLFRPCAQEINRVESQKGAS